jgi:hypothetical protein
LKLKANLRPSARTAVLLALLAGIGVYVVVDARADKAAELASEPSKPSVSASAATQAAASETKGKREALVLPERPGFDKPQTTLFGSHSWQPPPTPAAKAPPPPPPMAPPVPYTSVGRVVQDGRVLLYVAKGDAIFPVTVGETLEGTYKVAAITDSEIRFIYLPLNQAQSIPVLGSVSPPGSPPMAANRPAAAPPPTDARARAEPIPSAKVIAKPAASGATLAWGGPPQVKLGTRFDLTLRVTSDQPLHGWPMQLRFDPEHFEVVTVKPGKLSDGTDPSFSYRVSEGSIFIGASAQQPTSAAGSELLALTLKPVKVGSAAEVSIAALTLQGAAGRRIPHDGSVTFKTAIMP